MGYFVSQDGVYHEGDSLPGDAEVPQRPSQFHIWRGGQWVYAPTERDYVMAVQGMLDSKARERKYDDIASAATYDGDPDPIFAAEGAACKAWRSTVWRRCYEDLAKVQAGEMVQPTIEDFLASLPTLTWPNVA